MYITHTYFAHALPPMYTLTNIPHKHIYTVANTDTFKESD